MTRSRGPPACERIIHLKTLHLGPEELLVAAKIGVGAMTSAEDVAQAIDRAERAIRGAEPDRGGDLPRARHLPVRLPARPPARAASPTGALSQE